MPEEEFEQILDIKKDDYKPLTLGEMLKVENVISRPLILGGILDGAKLRIGSGNKVFKVEPDKGIWLGNADFDNAPFRVTLDGKIYATGAEIDGTSTIGGRLASTLAGAIDSSGHFIDTALDTSAKKILGDFTFGASGAIKIITDNNNGIWISPTGILGKKAGATTFSLTNTGDAVFKGEVLAGSIISCDISADRITTGTLTGRTVQTASSGNNRILLKANPDNSIEFWNANNIKVSGIYGNAYGGWELTNESSDVELAILDEIKVYGANFIPGESGLNLGSSSYKWQNLYLSGNIYVNGTVDGVDISAHASNPSAHHSSTSSGITIYPSGIVTYGDINLNLYDLTSVKYLRFSSSYGRIYWGSDIVLDIGTPNSACMTIGKHLYPSSTAAQINIGTTNQYFNAIYANYLYYHTGYYSFDKYDDLELIKKIDVKNPKTFPEEVMKEGFYNLGAFNGLIIGVLKQLIQKVEMLEQKIQ